MPPLRSLPAYLLTVLLLLAVPIAAPSAPSPLQQLDQDMTALQAEIDTRLVSESDARDLANRVEALRSDARGELAGAEEDVERVRELLQALGEPPAEGEPPESRELARQRKELQSALGKAESRVKSAQLLLRRADTALTRIGDARLAKLKSDLLVRGAAPWRPDTWLQAFKQLNAARDVILAVPREQGLRFPLIVLLPVLAFVALSVWAGRLMRRALSNWGRNPDLTEPGYARRLLAALVVAFTRGFVPALVFIVLLLVVWNYYLLSALGMDLQQPLGLIQAVLVYLLGAGFIRAALSPMLPAWRVVPVGAEEARAMGVRAHALIAIEAVHLALGDMVNMAGRPPELLAVYGTIINFGAGLALASIVSPGLWSRPETTADTTGDEEVGEDGRLFWPLLRALVLIVGVGAPLANLGGYHQLAATVLHTTLQTLAMLVGFLSLHVLLRESLTLLFDADSGIGARLRQRLKMPETLARSLSFWLSLLLDIAVIAGALLSMLWLWGTPPRLVFEWLDSASEGIAIGSYTVVPADLVLATAAFLVVWLGTRLVQGLLERRLLPRTRLDIGVRTAITSGLGYVGLTLAAIVGVSVMGLDLTKLALIAGALSVGIGFGLQNIVNNFVSGLILLIERPIKIGDWVIVGAVEGTVRKVNVRSTRIETFNRADVIIPNADLLQQSVVNWTHKSKLGRVDLAVGVAYASDIDLVERVLLDCAGAHPLIQRWPLPRVLLRGFGDSSLDFELRFFLANIEERVFVASDLRKAIVKAFREAGVEIPFPQRDLWVRDRGLPGAGAPAADALADDEADDDTDTCDGNGSAA